MNPETIGKCIYKAPKVQEIISEAMIAIATKDYTKLLDKIKESLPELIQIVFGCINEQPAVEDAPKAEIMWTTFCYTCELYGSRIPMVWDSCYERCGLKPKK